MSPLSLTRVLVALPTHVGDSNDEREASTYVATYLEQRYPWLRVQRQDIGDGRFNVIARSPGQPRLLLAGHLDTVDPRPGWQFNPLGEEVGERFYGIGANDMKGGVACILAALEDLSPVEGLTLLFYCDEEYDFAGMKAFLGQTAEPRAQLAAVAEPTDLRLSNALRGLLELRVTVHGKTGHAARPYEGINAIDMLFESLVAVRVWLEQFNDIHLQRPCSNIAFFRGGLDKGDREGNFVLGQQGNNIADWAEAVFEVRTTRPELRTPVLAARLATELTSRRCTFEITTRHDLGSLNTRREDLTTVEGILRKVLADNTPLDSAAAALAQLYKDPFTSGYGDGQMIAEHWGIPVFELGPVGANMHAPDEWVEIESLNVCTTFYRQLITQYCG